MSIVVRIGLLIASGWLLAAGVAKADPICGPGMNVDPRHADICQPGNPVAGPNGGPGNFPYPLPGQGGVYGDLPYGGN